MPSLALRKTTYDGLSAARKAVVNLVAERLDLGTPAQYTAPGGNVWYIYDDEEITLRDCAILGKVAANLASLNITVAGKTKAQIRAELLAWVQSLNIVWPASIDYTGQSNPYQYTLTQNGAPASVQAADRVPDTWAPVTF